MGKRKYIVRLSSQERIDLQRIIKTGRVAAIKRQRAQILLYADQGEEGGAMMNTQITHQLDSSIKTVERACKRLLKVGFSTCLERVSRAAKPRKMDGEKEAQLVAISCMDSPEGTKRWTLKLLAARFVALGHVESISPETIRQVLKKRHKTLAT
jgi:transposase